MLIDEQLRKTPLYDEHLALNARIVSFGGWAMPVQYDGILQEHAHTRQAVSVFDVSHMGEFTIEGDYSESGLDRIVTMPLADLPVHACRYGCMINRQGGVIDDLIVFRLEKNKWFIVVNGATARKDAEHFRNHLSESAVFNDVSAQTGKIDIQGPRSRDVLRLLASGIEKLDYYSFDFFNLLGENVLISRTGYTGELGYEIYFPWDRTLDLWREFIKHAPVKPAGLGARDTLRLEMGYSLYGHELSEDISPLDSGLSRFIQMDKEFIGREALLRQKEQGIKRTIVGLQSFSRRAPRQGHKIYSSSGQDIGMVTSGTFSPSLNIGIGLGFVELPYAQRGTAVIFGSEKNKDKAVVTARTVYRAGSLKH